MLQQFNKPTTEEIIPVFLDLFCFNVTYFSYWLCPLRVWVHATNDSPGLDMDKSLLRKRTLNETNKRKHKKQKSKNKPVKTVSCKNTVLHITIERHFFFLPNRSWFAYLTSDILQNPLFSIR